MLLCLLVAVLVLVAAVFFALAITAKMKQSLMVWVEETVYVVVIAVTAWFVEGVISLGCEMVRKTFVAFQKPGEFITYAKTREALIECCSNLGEFEQQYSLIALQYLVLGGVPEGFRLGLEERRKLGLCV